MDASLYKELPYIICDGRNNIYIDKLNITEKSKLYYKGNIFPRNESLGVLGYCDDSAFGDNFGIEIFSNNRISFSHGSTHTNTEIYVTKLNNIVEAEFTGNGYIKINNQIIDNTANATTFSRNDLIILDGYNGEDADGASQYVYRIKLYEDGTTLSYDFIPCKRLSDNVVGLYDNIHNKFCCNKYDKDAFKAPNNIMPNIKAIQIPEGNVTKIEDKEGKILWANINKAANIQNTIL